MPHTKTIAVLTFATLLRLDAAAQILRVQPAPKREVRAVWLTTSAGLDWPKSLDRDEQQASLRDIVARLKEAHFNTILFQVRARGDAYYHSSYEPWAENLTGTLGKDPGWDPLAMLLTEAHRAGMEVHTWFNVYKVRGALPVRESFPAHPTQRFKPWVYEVDGGGWLDPGVPEIREYLVDVALEVVREYDIDGMNFDFIRYPGKNFPDDVTYRRYGRGADRDTWRRANIEKFVAAFYDSAMRIKPMLKVGSSPLGVFRGGSGSREWGAYASYYQDSRGWVRSGNHDYLSPQLYWGLDSTGESPGFATLARDWKRGSSDRQIWAGIGVYKPEVLRDLPRLIDSARAIGVDGQVIFRYDFVKDMKILGDRYITLANIPPMPWKDPIPPHAPTDLIAREPLPNIVHLEWQPPSPARDGDRAQSYDIYRSADGPIDPDDPSYLLAIVPGNVTSFADTIRAGSGYRYTYAVSALDKGNNESPLSMEAGVTLMKLAELRGKLSEFTTLSASVSRGGAATLVAYRVAARSAVLLRVTVEGADSVHEGGLTLVNAVQDAGTYVVGIPADRLRSGPHLLRLVAGDIRIEHPLVIEH